MFMKPLNLKASAMVCSMDLRRRVVKAAGEGQPIAEVVRTLGGERWTVRAWRDRDAAGARWN